MCDERADTELTHRPRGVLVAEDRPGLLTLVCAALGTAGYRVWGAGDGEEALRLYRTHAGEIDAALLDRDMPVKDGPATLAELRALAPTLPCCVMTGAGPAVERQLLSLGASCVLAKPFLLPELVAMMKGLCPGKAKLVDAAPILIPDDSAGACGPVMPSPGDGP
jgi:DNA-binding response OmpR family regulator